MMRPSKEENQNILVCNSCGKFMPLEDEMIDSYRFRKEIYHPPGEEFKNLEKMENWKEKEIYNKFKE